MFKFILGNEKAIVGGATAGILTLLALVGVTNQMTVKEAVAALVSWLLTHAMVWLTTNTKFSPSPTPVQLVSNSPTIITPEEVQ